MVEHNTKKLNDKINYLQRLVQSSLNIGEQITSNHLQEIFCEFKNDKIIEHYAIYNNILIEDEDKIRQIDHFVICNNGIFIIETKHWKGDIYFNFNKDNLKDYHLEGLKKYLFTINDDNYITFILSNENNEFAFKKFGHPFDQVNKTRKFANEIIGAQFIEMIIYFNHKGNGQLYVGNTPKFVATPSSKTELKETLLHKITQNKVRTCIDATTIMSFCEVLNKYANNDASIINVNG
ncbi:nuclease-related domain-containing protein [Staphylococcus gallinarum]|uniref:nuclease-related domain-containing protein n=1 Tax=Staphylococcus gallinarum TaxID=1293 RepID=UPI0024426E7D|nr:nuclease-related domain-containing protein [Staphylococcus gallinarum]MEB7038677.1 NERD domain-containing protein [Staphylococcus gallinarum]